MSASSLRHALLGGVAGLALGPAVAQTPQQAPPAPAAPIIYPAKGQTAEKLEKDKAECYGWAQKQTGYDPVAAAQQSGAAQQGTGSAAGGETARGAARGAAAGAAVGAVAGDAGKGAAAGAAVGGVGGRAKKKGKEAQQQEQAAQQQEQASQQLGQYQKAFAACIEGRGYTLK